MDNLQTAPITMCFANAGLAVGTTTTISTGKAVDYAIRSKAYTRAALGNAATPTTDAATGNAFPSISRNQGTVVVIGLDAAGNVRAMQGTTAPLDGGGAFATAPQFPVVPDWICPIGYFLVRADNTFTGSWTFGGSNFAGITGLTATPVNVVHMPDRPQIT